MWSRLCLALLVLSCVGVVPASAQSQNYPGIGCVPLGSPQQAIAASRVSEFYRVNLSPLPTAFVCPVVSDLNNGEKNGVWVQVFASSRLGTSISCEVFGTITQADTQPITIARAQQSRAGLGVNTPVLIFLELTIPDTTPTFPREFSVTCQVPTGGRLYRYWVSVFEI